MTTISPTDLPGDREHDPNADIPGINAPVDPVHGHHWRNLGDEQEGAKFGMWLFLSTEVLLFAGFFCLYAAFRMWYPENWHDASRYYLNWKIGAFNTVVLLVSSFTVVLAIRSIQLKRRINSLIYQGITVACAVAFLFIKIVWEYIPKIKKGELPGANYNYLGGFSHAPAEAAPAVHAAAHNAPEAPAIIHAADAHASAESLYAGGPAWAKNLPSLEVPAIFDTGKHAFDPGTHDHIFLSIYWIATGTHGLHVLVGVFLFAWTMWKTAKWHYGPKNVTSLENVGLYWHIVDVIWIFLFPLMYLV